MHFRIGDGNAETRAEQTQFFIVQLFLLVSDVLALTCLTQSVSFNSLRQNNGGPTRVIHRSFVCRVHFERVVASKPHAGELLVREMLNHLQQTGIGAEKVVPEVSAALHEVFLILAVGDLAHPLDQQSVTIILDKAVPVGSPDALDYVPSRAAENGFEFLDDLAVAAHRAIEPL